LINRRKALKFLTIIGGALLWPASWLQAQAQKIAFKINKVAKLREVHGWAILKIKDRQILFVRDSENTIKALNPICTHKQCTVEYSREKGRIVCPCHGSEYALDGRVLKEPSTEPLGIYESELRQDGLIVVTLEEIKYTEMKKENGESSENKKEQKDGQ